MAFVSREEFLAMQAQQESQRSQRSTGPRVGFFSLRDDGDEAIVRFPYKSPDEFEVYTVHPVTIDGRFRKVNCINDLKLGVHSCPLCAAGVQLQQRFYIKLIEYTRDEQGNIVPQAKIWERPASYMQILANLFAEYGPLCDNVFKVKRSGERGSMQTTYSIMFGNPTIYNDELYVKDFSMFDNYSPLGTAIIDKDEAELAVMAYEMGLEAPATTGISESTQHEYVPPKTGVDRPQTYQTQSGAQRIPVKY